MSTSGQITVGGIYAVEVSGWDSDELFFVEKSTLEWDGDDAKRVKLRRPLRKGAVIFVRLTQNSSTLRAYPIAYEVEPRKTCEDGGCEYGLRQIQPRNRRAPYGLG